MKRLLLFFVLPAAVSVAGTALGNNPPVVMTPIGVEPGTAAFLRFNELFTGDWQQYGQLFTGLQSELFNRIFLLVLTVIPAVFLLHSILVGAKHFDHNGEDVFFFSAFVRVVHWLAALSFSLLVVTGLLIIFGKLFGGGSLILSSRIVHLVSALLFTLSAVVMFPVWLKDMLPMPHDLAWLFIMGGYLTRTKKPVPAGKFNAGQKMWFWLATVGGGVMAYSGWYLYTFQLAVDRLRIMALIHNFLGAALVAMYLVHLYMSLFAIKGAVQSMITGYKPREEVEILHSRYRIPS